MTINQLIKKLINTAAQGYSYDTLDATIIKDSILNNKSLFWESFLNFLHSETTQLQHAPLIRQDDFDTADDATVKSVFGYINKMADLDDSVLESLIDTIVEKINNSEDSINLNTTTGMASNGAITMPYFWNESVNKAIVHYLKFFSPQTIDFNEGYNWGTDTISIDNSLIYDTSAAGRYSLEDLYEADAGNSFIEFEDFSSSWVIPWHNYDMKTFTNVLDINAVNSVATNEKKLQFIHAGVEKYIRLLMPQNARRVEILDLNRNFWVIGQVITIISEYLFGGNSTINNQLKMMLNEVTQLWENIAYLWLYYAILYHQQSEVEVIIVPVTNNENHTNVTYDMYSETVSGNIAQLQARLHYLIEQRPQKNFVVIPQIRRYNYQKNYYKLEQYPFVLIHKAGENTYSKTMSILYKRTSTSNYTVMSFSVNGAINSVGYGPDCSDSIIAFRPKDGEYFTRIQEYGDINNLHEDEPKPYYGAIRVVPHAEVTSENGVITFSELNFTVFDVWNPSRVLAQFVVDDTQNNTNSFHLKNTVISMPTYSNCKFIGDATQSTTPFYLGEVVSDISCTRYIPETFSLNLNEVMLRPTTTQLTSDTVANILATNFKNNYFDNTVLDLWAESQDDSSDRDNHFQLYFGRHRCGIYYLEGGNVTNWAYKQLNTTHTAVIENSGSAFNQYTAFSSNLDTTAVLYNPIVRKTYSYGDYQWYSETPTSLLNIDSSINAYRGWIHDDSFTYILNTASKMTANNWLVKYTQCSGGGYPISCESQYRTNTGEPYACVCTKIKVHIFTPTAYAWIQYRRKIEGTTVLGTWEVDGYSSNYVAIRDNSMANYKRIYGSEYDFQNYHNNGKTN